MQGLLALWGGESKACVALVWDGVRPDLASVVTAPCLDTPGPSSHICAR